MIIEAPEEYPEPLTKWFKNMMDDIDNGNLIKDECRCRTVGRDDGDKTCWVHHDCTHGYCTHMDGAEDYV